VERFTGSPLPRSGRPALKAWCAWLLFVTLALPGTVLSSGNGVTLLRADRNGVELEVYCTTVVGPFVTGDSLTTFSLTAPGFSESRTPNGPCLPSRGIPIAVPSQSDAVITLTAESSRELDPPPVPIGSPPEGPSAPVFIGIRGLVRDLEVAQVMIRPAVVVPGTDRLRHYEYLRFRVDFRRAFDETAGDGKQVDPLDPLLRSLVVNPEQVDLFKKARDQTRQAPVLLQTHGDRYKLEVRREGVYRVKGSELEDRGMEIASVDPRMLHLGHAGEPVPIYVHGDGDGRLDAEDYIEFYGVGPAGDYTHMSLYTLDNVYWLFEGDSPGLGLVDEDGGLIETDPALLEMPLSYDYTLHGETENWFERLPNDTMQEQDVWFWDMVSASEQGIKDFPLVLHSPDQNSADTLYMKLGLQGLSHHTAVDPDHHCLVYLNGALAGGSYWDGQHTYLFNSEREGTGLENHVLLDSLNTLSLVMPGDTPAGSDDRILLNWVEVGYKRLFRAAGDYIRFSKPRDGPYGLYQFTVEGFSNPDIAVYKLGKSRLVNLKIEPVILFGDTTYRAVFQTEIISEGVEFVALTESKRSNVASLKADEPSSLFSPLNSADIIVIAHDSLANAAEEYVSFRESQGYRVALARVSDIYDEYSGGVRDAKAIREFLRYAYSSWALPSFFACVLVGDGNADDRDLNGRGGNLIPIHLERSIYSGLVASDNWFACVSGEDILPDVAISRIPASNPGQVSDVIEKLRSSELDPVLDDWRRKVLYVAGSGGGYNVTFRELMEDSVAQVHLPIWAEGERVYAERDPGMDPDPFFGGKPELMAHLNEGVSMVQYLGHGSGGTWSNPYLLTPEDVPLLDNSGRLPLVASFTCFTAVFDQPTRWSLGEALVLEPAKGAAAVIGATALGYFWEDVNMARSVSETAFSSSTGTTGELFLLSKLSYAFENFGGYASTMIKCQTLLGDAASELLLPRPSVSVSVDPRSAARGDSLHVSLDAGSADLDSAIVALFDSTGVFAEARAELVQGTGTAVFEVPQSVKSGTALARAYVWDTGSPSDALGAAEFAIAAPSVFEVRTVPRTPGPLDTVHVEAGVFYSGAVDSVNLCWGRSRSPGTWARIPMLPAIGDTFRTSSAIPVQTPGRPVCYMVAAHASDGKTIESQVQCYSVMELPNLLLLREEDIVLTGTRRVEVSARVFNSGDTDVDSCRILFRSLPDSGIIGQGWTRVPALEYGEVSAPWTVQGPVWDVYVEIDPDSTIHESIETDNTSIGYPTRILVDRFNACKTSGTGGPVFSADSCLACDIPPDAVSDSVVLRLRAVPPHLSVQPAMKFAAIPGTKSGRGYDISFADSSFRLEPGRNLDLRLVFDSSDSLNNQYRSLLAAYRHNPHSDKWTKQDGEVDSTSVGLQVGELGEYAVLMSTDSEPPRIKLSVKDQAFASGDYVPRDPAIYFMLSDENGIDVDRGPAILLNGLGVDPGSCVWPERPADGNELQVAFYPKLEDGGHDISVKCWDCAGNEATYDFEVMVASEFGVLGLGNYPNPVRSNETVFAFSLTGGADEAGLAIYSPSGRLVRSFDRGRWWDLADIGYHEVVWNLTDENGMPVANGVYFYVLRIERDGTVHREKGKMAVLR